MTWLPDEILQKAVALGFTAMHVPVEYGGMGGDLIDDVILAEEVSRRSAAASFGLHSGMFVRLIHTYGTEKQKNEYLPKLAQRRNRFLHRVDRTGWWN